MDTPKSNAIENYQQYIDLAIQYGISFALKLLLALLIFLIGKRIAGLIAKFTMRTMKKKEVDTELSEFLESMLYWGLIAVVVIAALGQLGVQTASMLAIFGAAGLAIGLALQGSLSNFAAGVLILILRPYKVGDFVDMVGESGIVKDIYIFTTELLTGDNKCVIIPNARVLNSNIVNHSSTGVRRVDLVFGIGYDDDLDQARNVIQQIADADERVIKAKGMQIAVSELADSSVNFVVRPWVKTADYWGVYFDMTEQVKKEFDAHGITIPYPQQVIHRPEIP